MRLYIKSIMISALLMLLSCGGGVSNAEEIISVASPATLNVDHATGEAAVELKANCAWTAQAQGKDGSDAGWVSLSRSKGNGDAKVTLWYTKNPLSVSREAVVTFITDGGKTASVTIVQGGDDQGSSASSVEVRLGSYNIRMSNMDNSSADNKWSVRKSRLWTSIRDCGFDVFGLQEVSSAAQTDLKLEFGGTYGMVFFSPYAQSGQGDKAQGIMFRSDKFTLSDFHYFWLGPDPDKMSSSDVTASATYNRGGCCAVITHKATGVKFFFMNTHGCLSADSRTAYAAVFEQMEKRYNPEGLPSVFVGDFNEQPTGDMYKTIVGYWKDAWLSAQQKTGIENTFNSFSMPNGKSRIDYVFYRGKASAKHFCCDNTLYGGLYPSDHFPIYTDFILSK